MLGEANNLNVAPINEQLHANLPQHSPLIGGSMERLNKNQSDGHLLGVPSSINNN